LCDGLYFTFQSSLRVARQRKRASPALLFIQFPKIPIRFFLLFVVQLCVRFSLIGYAFGHNSCAETAKEAAAVTLYR